MKRLVYIPLLCKKRNIGRILIFYKKVNEKCEYDTINQVFVKNAKYIAAVYLGLGVKTSLGQAVVLNRRKGM
ncbi:hypothetical protein [Priestia megaterium]|uniref:hypothetical protein n=1 Tax=Priestia megaterium TaxID=1404 RepID=UPI003CF4C8D2